MGLEGKRQIIEVDKKLGNSKKEMRIRIIKEAIADLEKIKEPSARQLAELERLRNQLSEWESRL